MDKIAIERHLRLHILNLCLAVAGERDGDIELCKKNLVHEVKKMIDGPRLRQSADKGLSIK